MNNVDFSRQSPALSMGSNQIKTIVSYNLCSKVLDTFAVNAGTMYGKYSVFNYKQRFNYSYVCVFNDLKGQNTGECNTGKV